MPALVLLTDGAARDVDEGYAGAYDAGGRLEAEAFLDRIRTMFRTVSERPERGSAIKAIGRSPGPSVQQLRVGDERMVYIVRDDRVYVVAVAPGRQSMQALLQRRMWDA